MRLSYQGTDDITENATGTAPTGFVSTSNGGTISTVTYNNIPQVRVGVQAAWSGGGKKLDNAATVAGTAYKLTLTLDKGTVAGNLNIKIGEQGASGSGLYNEIYNGTITTSGTYTIDFVTPGINPNLYVRIDKGDGALSSVRYFYVSRVKVERKGVSVVEEDNYYAFGMKHGGYNNVPGTSRNLAAQRYKYNDKEFQDELNLNWYDYGARNYDPALGRWFNIDPLAEKSRRFSPYTYTLNNPVFFIDPDGMEAEASGGGGMSDQLDVDTEIEIDAGYGRKVTSKNRSMSMSASVDLSDGENSKIIGNLKAKAISDIINGEPPIDLFGTSENSGSAFHKVPEGFSYKDGDGVFYIFGHANSEGISYYDSAGNKAFLSTPEELFKVLESKSQAWRDAKKSGKFITLIFYACNVASEEWVSASGDYYYPNGTTFAQKVSKALGNNGKVIAPDGFTAFGWENNDPKSGKAKITGYYNHKGDAGLITFKNNKRISKITLQDGSSRVETFKKKK